MIEFPELPEELRILHVDDSAQFRALTTDFLEGVGDSIHVESCESGSAALSVLEETRIDCVVSDYEMPGIDGLALLGRIRQRHPEVPFVLLTNRGDDDLLTRAIDAGVTDFVPKAASRAHVTLLATRIENAVERHQWRRQRRALSMALAVSRSSLAPAVDDSVAGDACRAIASTVPYDCAWVGRVTPDAQWVSVISGATAGTFDATDMGRIRVAGGGPDDVIESAVRQGSPAIATDPGGVGARSPTTGAGPAPAAAGALPLKRHGDVVGVLGLTARRTTAFGSTELAALEWIADRLAAQIQPVGRSDRIEAEVPGR